MASLTIIVTQPTDKNDNPAQDDQGNLLPPQLQYHAEGFPRRPDGKTDRFSLLGIAVDFQGAILNEEMMERQEAMMAAMEAQLKAQADALPDPVVVAKEAEAKEATEAAKKAATKPKLKTPRRR